MLILPILYVIVIGFFIVGILKGSKNLPHKDNYISVIVAAKDEEKNILNLIKSLENQTYKKFELIIINDRSIDKTHKLVSDYMNNSLIDIRLYRIQGENRVGKKKAIELGISMAKYDILAFTDADCIVPEKWLEIINLYFDDKTDFVCGYSELIYKNKYVTYLKNIERSGYLAAVAGAYAWNLDLSATASNMAYRKHLFYQVNGFSKIDNVKSGDDDLLLHKLKFYIRNLKFLLTSDAVVKSYVFKNLKQQYETEKRRASKWKYYPLWIKILTFFIFIYYVWFIITILGLIGNWEIVSILLSIKILPEFFLIYIFLKKIGREKYIKAFLVAELIYIPYFIYFGIKGLSGKYKWKD